jgi:hypothetical protein
MHWIKDRFVVSALYKTAPTNDFLPAGHGTHHKEAVLAVTM